MLSSVLSAPAPFKPTLVSEYFFSEPVQPSSSPDIDSPQAAEQQAQQYRAKKHAPQYEAIPEAAASGSSVVPDAAAAAVVAAPMDCEIDLEQQKQAALPPVMLLLEESSKKSQPSSAVGSPTHGIQQQPYYQQSMQPQQQQQQQQQQPSSAPRSPVTGHSLKIHQRLMDAAMADGQHPQPQQQHQRQSHAAPLLQDAGSRKYSTVSTDSACVSLTSGGMSTGNNSNTNSPISPTLSDTNMESQVHTPSPPPPLALPQNAAQQQQQQPHVITDAVIYSSQQSRTTPQPHSSPTQYRTVPAAASHIPPVVLPQSVVQQQHQQQQQHAQTPKQEPSSHHHNNNRAHVHAAHHSTPGTPQTHKTHHASQGDSGHHHHHHHQAAHHHSSNSTQVHPTSAGAAAATPFNLEYVNQQSNVEYVGPFILGPVLGRGCTGTVRLGTHRDTKFEVAFKIIEKKYLIGDQEGGGGAHSSNVDESKLWQKVKREIVILKLIEHPHVLKLYDVLETEGRLYLVLENVRGGELFDYIVSKGRLERTEALRICAQIVMGLEHCHSHGICHRDLKPENLLLDSARNIKIADFGMAQLMKKDGILKTSCGSPHYASPEIIEGRTYDAKCTDVWSIGCILFALITGSLPFDHDNIPTLLTMVTRGHYTTPAHVPADIAHLISRMLTVDPTKRITIPEIRKHICFKGYNYFSLPPPHDSTAAATERRTAAAKEKEKEHSHALPPHKKYKPTANNNSSSASSHANDDSSDEERDGTLEHAWRKKTPQHAGGAGGAPYLPPHPHAHAHSMSSSLPTGSSHSFAASSSSPALRAQQPHLLSDDVIDDAVLNDLESLGLGSKDGGVGGREELKKKIRATETGKEPSLEQVFYKLLKQRKMDRLKELAVLSPKISPTAVPKPRHRSHRDVHSSHQHTTKAARSGGEDGASIGYVASQPGSASIAPMSHHHHHHHHPAAGGAAACSSQPTSHLNSPMTTRGEDVLSHSIAELTLPPPASRTSVSGGGGGQGANNSSSGSDSRSNSGSGSDSSTGSDVQSSSTPIIGSVAGGGLGMPMFPSSGTSIMSNTPAAAAVPTNPILQSSIFAPVTLAATAAITTAQVAQQQQQQQAKSETSSVDQSAGLLPLSPRVPVVSTMAPSASTLSVGIPAAVGVACAVSGAQALLAASLSVSPSPTSPPMMPSASPVSATAISVSVGVGGGVGVGVGVVTQPPLIQKCHSDGSVPDSILSEDHPHTHPSGSYYRSTTATLPSLALPPQTNPQSPSSAIHLIPDSSASAASSRPLSSRDFTAPPTPIDERLLQSMQASSFSFANAFDAKPSPPHSDMVDEEQGQAQQMLLQATSSSANVSPVTTQRPPIFQRRMSTPQTHIQGEVGAGSNSSSSAVNRQLFLDDDHLAAMELQRQAALDQYGRQPYQHLHLQGPPSAESMDLQLESSVQSAPMHPQLHMTSPPPLTLPRTAAPHMQVRVRIGESSGSESDRERGDEVDAPERQHHPYGVTRPSGTVSGGRPRAYSQDESNHMGGGGANNKPSDSVASNVRTPMLSPSQDSAAPHALPMYTTTPRFHRVKFYPEVANAAAAASETKAAAGRPAGARTGASSRTLPANLMQAPPSPAQKKSWFSSVFGNNGFSLFDRLKGKRTGGGSGNKHPSSSGGAAAAAASSSSSAAQASLSPLLSPSTPNTTYAVSTKRATLTLTNDLSRLFNASGIQFVKKSGYKFEASYQPQLAGKESSSLMGSSFHTPPMPPVPMPMPPMPMPALQRAVSTPGEAAGIVQRPRSSSIAADSSSSGAKKDAALAAANAAAASASAAGGDNQGSSHARAARHVVPSTPKPTPTRTLNQPFVPSSLQYPMMLEDRPVEDEPADLMRNLSNTSTISSSGSSSSSESPSDLMSATTPNTASITQSPVTATPASASSSSSSSNATSRHPRATVPVSAAPFGHAGVRFTCTIQESAHDTRCVILTRKSGDSVAFNRIVEHLDAKLHGIA